MDTHLPPHAQTIERTVEVISAQAKLARKYLMALDFKALNEKVGLWLSAWSKVREYPDRYKEFVECWGAVYPRGRVNAMEALSSFADAVREVDAKQAYNALEKLEEEVAKWEALLDEHRA